MYRKLLLFFVMSLLVISSGCTTPVPDSPAPVQPTLPATGSLELSSVPPQSEIYLDGVYRGTTPSIIPDVSTGTHTLEFRSREYHSWSASVVVQGGIRSYINATLSPVVTQTPVPTTEPTARPTTPMPKTVAGCWELEFTNGNATITYNYELEARQTGWFWGTRKTPTLTETVGPFGVTWSLDPNTSVITILQADPNDPAKIHTTVLTYDEHADILDGGGKGTVPMIFVRVPC
jgi:PEGA domain